MQWVERPIAVAPDDLGPRWKSVSNRRPNGLYGPVRLSTVGIKID